MKKLIITLSLLVLSIPALAQNAQLPPSCPGAIPALAACQSFSCSYQPPQIIEMLQGMVASAAGKNLNTQQQAALKQQEDELRQMVFHRAVQPMAGGICQFTDLSGKTTIVCNLNPQQRTDLAQYLQKSANAHSVEKTTSFDKSAKQVIKLDGQEVRDVYNEFLQNGTCK